MAKTPDQPTSVTLTIEGARQGILRLGKRLSEVRGFSPEAVDVNNPTAAVAPLRVSIDEALVRTFGHKTIEYERYRRASNFTWPILFGPGNNGNQIVDALKRCKQNSIALLEQAILSLEEFLEEEIALAGQVQVSAVDPNVQLESDNSNVFIVHGQAEGPREGVARFLMQAGFTPIILHERPNEGRTIIEKFEHHAEVGFAVVLLTPDDIGGKVGEQSQKHRARQNVLLELGYFIGRLGRSRVVALKQGEIELPSDILGVVWIDLDAAGAWRVGLGKELQAAGYHVDWNTVMRI